MTEKKKRSVLFVAHHLTIGGVQKSLVSALNAIDYEENDVTLYLRKDRRDLLPYINPNVKVLVNQDPHHYYRTPKGVFYQLGIALAKLTGSGKREQRLKEKLTDYLLRRQMEYERATYFSRGTYDVAIAYVQGYVTKFVAQYVPAKKKIAFYQVSTDENHRIHERAFPYFDKIVVEHPDIKEALAGWYKGSLNPEAIVVLANFVDVDLLEKQGKEKAISQKENCVSICSCGRFSPVKGFDLAVKAAEILRQRGCQFVWYLVGDGPERGNIEKMIRASQLQDQVKLAGMQKNPYPYIANCDIYVQPSKEEAHSIAILEAQLLARPMVITKTVGGCTMVKDQVDGLLTEIDAQALANGIERLLEQPQLRERFHRELSKIDRTAEKNRYQKEWAALLEA